MKHEIRVLGCGVIYIDNERVFGSKPYGLFSTVNWSATDEDLKRIADRCLELVADRKTEDSSENPNNCEPKLLDITYYCSNSDCDYIDDFGFNKRCILCERKQSTVEYRDEPTERSSE